MACNAPQGYVSDNTDNNDNEDFAEIVTATYSNLYAPATGGQGAPIAGDFTKFDFSTGEITTSETDWDIAFRTTTIIVNGGVSMGTVDEPDRTGNAGAYIVDSTFDGVTQVNTNDFLQDTVTILAIPTGSGNGWYNYSSPPTHVITPIPGKILVFRTAEGTYAKVEIYSYYLDAPPNPDYTMPARYYTFKYSFQPNDGLTNF
ncbi:MAG: hypothetical protein HRT68_00270 [Flavobacteriaceae bacterium]|nr:hypothetical protein [Flavobacteriaceae bacterium]